MAANLKASSKTPVAPPWWEKQGNVIWVVCINCSGWFHVSDKLAASDKALVCPFCRTSFQFDQAKAVQ